VNAALFAGHGGNMPGPKPVVGIELKSRRLVRVIYTKLGFFFFGHAYFLKGRARHNQRRARPYEKPCGFYRADPALKKGFFKTLLVVKVSLLKKIK
jgi:hypothetical protein